MIVAHTGMNADSTRIAFINSHLQLSEVGIHASVM